MKIKSTFLSIVLLYCNGLFSQALNGNYTIGGTSPSYATIAAAVSDLQTKGIAGSVVFNIRNGVYTESTTIAQITGASSTKTITFQSESGDSTAVILKFNSGFVVFLNGADYLIFKKLTFEGPQSGATSAVLMTMSNGASNNKFLNNVFKGNPAATGASGDLVQSGNYLDSGNVYMHNVFNYGYRGMYLYASTGKGQGLVISNNEFYNNNNTSVYVSYQNGVNINSNKITNTLGKGPYGIYVYNVDKAIKIQKNIISMSSMTAFGVGIYLNTCNATTTSRSLVSNNFISISGSAVNGYGINLSDARYVDVYNNSINLLLKQASTNYALNVASGSNKIKVFNNSMVSMGSDKILFYYNLSVDSSDYNNFYTGANFYFHTYKSTNYWLSSFQIWKDSVKRDYNSITTNPYYNSFSDLHLSNSFLNNKGLARNEITTDIDGEVRNIIPDIGADEYIPTLLDAGVVVNSLPAIVCNSNPNAEVTLKNYGGILINQVTINWKLNGVVQAPYNWSGSLSSGGEAVVNLGVASLNLLVSNTITAWTSLPNNQADQNAINDTTTIQNIYVALNGSYTIGGTTPSFTNLKAFCGLINNAGVCGPVIVNIRNGIYNDSLALFPAGTSSVNTILIRGESLDSSLVRIRRLVSGTAPISMTKTSNITIQHITFESNVSGTIVSLGNALHHITIKSCVVKGLVASGPKPNGIIGAVDSVITIENVLISNVMDLAISLIGNISSPRVIDITIKNCNMAEVYIETATDLKISGCTFRDSQFWYVNGFTITDNKVYGVSVNRLKPIFMRSCNGTAAKYSLIANNFLTNLKTDSINNGSLEAIMLYDCGFYNFINNNLCIKNPYKHPGPNAAIWIHNPISSLRPAVFKNNVFANLSTGYAVFLQTSTNAPLSNNVFDHNDYYVQKGTPLVLYSKYSGAIYLKDIPNILFDTAAISADPKYVNWTSDLHVTEPALNNTALPFPGITNDIDRQVRDLQNPDIGADEFDALPYAPLADTTKWCTGTALLLNAGNPQASYLWSTGATVQKISVSSSGQYWVTVTNGLGSLTDTTIVMVVPVPSLNLGKDTTITTSQTLTLNSGAGYASYLWSTSATTSSITVNGSTLGVGTFTYTVMVTNANGCSKSDTIKVNVDAATGITDVSGNLFNVYYNAEKNMIIVQSKAITTVSGIKLYTVSGQVINQDVSFDGNSISINTVSLSVGIYILEFQVKDTMYHTKLMVK
ncbi:MAG: right-handed parallel beta-helix repeat-containing protein [Bacteroidota bacterium]